MFNNQSDGVRLVEETAQHKMGMRTRLIVAALLGFVITAALMLPSASTFGSFTALCLYVAASCGVYVALPTLSYVTCRQRVVGMSVSFIFALSLMSVGDPASRIHALLPSFVLTGSLHFRVLLVLFTIFRCVCVAIALFLAYSVVLLWVQRMKSDECVGNDIATISVTQSDSEVSSSTTSSGATSSGAIISNQYHRCVDCIMRALRWLYNAIARIEFKCNSVLLLTAVLFILWIPMMIINGTFSIPLDTMVQLIQVRGFPAWDPMMMVPLPGYWMTDHNPFFDSLIYGAFDQLGLWLGCEKLGFVLLMALQSFVGALSLVVTIAWVACRTKLHKRIIVASFMLFALLPAWSSYMTIIMKDTTWVPFFTLWCVMFFEYVYRVMHRMHISWRWLLGFVVIAFLAGLMRKTSLYITMPCLLIVAVLLKQRVKALIAAIIPFVVALICIPMFLFPVLHIAQGGKQEVLGTPIQQVTAVFMKHERELAKEDIEIAHRVFNVHRAKKHFDKHCVDAAKQNMYRNAKSEDIAAFVRLWIRLFFRYPVDYVKAVSFIRYFFVIDDTYFTYGTMKCGWGPSGGYAILPKVQDCTLSPFRKHITVSFHKLMNKLPVVSFLGAEGLYVLWIPVFAIAGCILRKKWWNLLYLAPVALSWANLMLAPMHSVRYSINFLFCALLLVAVPFIEDTSATDASVADASVADAANSVECSK